MIVAIVNQTSPVGQVRVEEFRDAASEAVAVDDFVGGYTPPKNPADYLGFDTGWSTYTPPNPGYGWYYDFGAPGLVQVLRGDRFLPGYPLVQVISDAKADPSGGTTPFAWETMGRISSDLGYTFGNITKAQIRVWGQCKVDQVGVNIPQIRLQAGGVALSAEEDLPPTAGAWVNFFFFTTNAVREEGRKLYELQTKLRNAGSTIELRAVCFAMLEKR